MKLSITRAIAFAVVVLAGAASSPLLRAEEAPGRIGFLVATSVVSDGTSDLRSEVRIDGPAGTDFTISMDSARFRMKARFLTDPGADQVRMRTRLLTRRLYGLSPTGLPLWEEDHQEPSFDVGMDESLVLLPFGDPDGGETLKITILPSITQAEGPEDASPDRPIRIDILKQASEALTHVEAVKVPHWFDVDARLTREGRIVARGTGRLLLEERGRVVLEPASGAGATAPAPGLQVDLLVDDYIRSRPEDLVSIGFDVNETTSREGASLSIARHYAGINALGRPFVYALPPGAGESGAKPAQLELRVRLAPGPEEQGDRP